MFKEVKTPKVLPGVTQKIQFSVVRVEEGGGFSVVSLIMGDDDISYLEEELVQLSVKSKPILPSEKPTLICSIWTKRTYSPDSLRAQFKSIWKTKGKYEITLAGPNLFLVVFDYEEDLELILEGRP